MTDKGQLLSTLLDESSDAVAVCNSRLEFLLVNSAFQQVLGYDSQQLAGHSLQELTEDCNEPGLFTALSRSLEAIGEWRGELACCAADESIYQTEVVLKRSGTDHVLVMRDLFKQGASVSRGLQLDALTGLPNRYLLKDRLEQALVTAKRSEQSLGILTLGVDHFTRVNDGLGHEFGDSALIEIAQRLKHSIRRSDTVARIEGDTFVLLLPTRISEDAVTVTEKLLKAVNVPLQIGTQMLNLTVSIGIAVFPNDGEAGDALLKRSGSAMHHAKRVGRNCYQFFSKEMNRKAKQRIQLENDLRRALDHDEFTLYYQPKVCIDSGEIVGAEALIRWRHPEKGLVLPGTFIPTAEESGLIQPIGNWVMAEALRQSSLWRHIRPNPVRISVNMSAPQFHNQELVSHISRLLDRYAVPPECLELEITESMLMGNPRQVQQRLQALRELGVYVSIDDFGTGYSSLSYLTQFPITTLKIDRSFIGDLSVNPGNAEITRAIINLSKGLALEVVAEGVETAAHLEFLRENGCSTVQGFLYSRPVPAVEFERLLAKGRMIYDAAGSDVYAPSCD